MKPSQISADISLYQNVISASMEAAREVVSDLETESAARDCLSDMLGHLGDLSGQAKEGPQAQTFYSLSNSVRAIHANVGAIIKQLGDLRRGMVPTPPATKPR